MKKGILFLFLIVVLSAVSYISFPRKEGFGGHGSNHGGSNHVAFGGSSWGGYRRSSPYNRGSFYLENSSDYPYPYPYPTVPYAFPPYYNPYIDYPYYLPVYSP